MIIPRNRLGLASDADIARDVGCTRAEVGNLRRALGIPAYVPDPLAGADLTRPTPDLCATYRVSARTVRAARLEAGLEVGPRKRGPRPPGAKVVRAAKVAPVAEVVVTGPRLCRPRSDEEWEREPVVRRTDR